MIVMIWIYIVNAVINAVLFGVFVDQFVIIRKKKNDQQEETDQSNIVMNRLNIPTDLREELHDYLRRTFTTKADQAELIEFFEDRVNPDLRKEVIAQIFKTILTQSKHFVQLRVLMRQDFKDQVEMAKIMKADVNKKVFSDKGDTRFN